MKYALGVLFLVAGLAHADEDANKKFLKELQGSYTPVTMTRAGEPAPQKFITTIAVTIKDNTFTVKFKENDKEVSHAATMVIATGEKPVHIDLTPTDGDNAGKPMLGIISVEKDTIKMCWCDSKVRTERPTAFESTAKNGALLMELKKK